MRKSTLIICVLLFNLLKLQAQRELQNPLIDSKETIAKGVALHDKGKYKEALAEYLKVPRSDTSYADVLHEIILSYYKDSNFVEAEKYGNIALSMYPYRNTEWYNLLADLYDDTQRSDLALKAYDTIIAQNPYSYTTYFNKGITLVRQLKYDEATVNFQKCVMLDPYYASAHYFLGQLALLKGNLVQAMMSFTTSLIVAPENRYANNTISLLNSIAEINTTITEDLQKYKAGKEDNFEDVQDIITSKAALDKSYKLKASLEDPIVRQLQVVLEKLEYNANDKGFWMQYYVPMFKTTWNNNQFEPMIFYAFSGLDIKNIKEYNQKEKKKIEAFSSSAVEYLSAIRESQELTVSKRPNAPQRLYVKDYIVNGKGAYAKNAKNEEVLAGPWEFYYSTGRLKSKGTFDSEGRRTGEWNYYYENGGLKETTNYTADLADGKSLVWYSNGLLYSETTYKDDKTEGIETIYFFNGRISSAINYKAGKKEGLAKYYSSNGYLSTVDHYSSDKQEGTETMYYPSGKTASVVNYVNNLPDGPYKEYFDNGKLEAEGNYVDGKKSGVWNTFLIDGKPDRVENYVKGEPEGENISYYPNGKMKSRHFFKKGSLDGKSEDFDDDGILYSETIFERGHLRDVKFYDKKGTLISNNNSRTGDAAVSFYNPDGIKLNQGYYTKDGLAEGKFTYYFKNGQVSAECFYKNDLLEGKKTWYYSNNKISEEGSYKNGKANGYFINYYVNGQVSDEGWYIDDQRQGTFIYYDLLGNITSKIYYLNDNVYGISEYYRPGGKPDNDEYYDNGWFNKIVEFDSTGKKMITSELNKGEGKVHFNHMNGSSFFESNYKFYKLNGPYTVTNADGSKASTTYYKNAKADSIYTAWYPSGKIRVQGKYNNGEKTGAWKYYYFNGKPYETEHYTNDKLDGFDTLYNEFGNIDKIYNFKNGLSDGETRYFGEKGEVMLVFYYKDDNIKGYSYEDKNGKLLPMIPIEKGSGTVDSYYKNGVKSAHIVFKEGAIDGERILYYITGREATHSSRISDLENGLKKIYYPDGKIMKEENYYYGQPHGSFKYYNEDGSLIYDINYYLGSLHGECKYYTSGKLSQTYIYYYGELEGRK